MNKLLIVVFIFCIPLFALGIADSIAKSNGSAVLIAASILIASIFICSKLEELKHK